MGSCSAYYHSPTTRRGISHRCTLATTDMGMVMSAQDAFPWEPLAGPGYRKQQWERMCDRIDELELEVRANDPGEPMTDECFPHRYHLYHLSYYQRDWKRLWRLTEYWVCIRCNHTSPGKIGWRK